MQTFQKEYESALSKIESKQTSLQEKLADYGSLFERVKRRMIRRYSGLGIWMSKSERFRNTAMRLKKCRQKACPGA